MDEKNEKQKRLNEFSVNINQRNSDFNQEIKGFKSLSDFLNKEVEFWNIKDPTSFSRNAIKGINELLRTVNSLESQIEQINLEQLPVELENLKNEIHNKINASKFLILSNSPKAHYLKEYYIKEPSRAMGAHQYLTNNPISNNNQEVWIGVLNAIIFEAENENKLYKRHRAERKAISELSKEFCEVLIKSKSEYQIFNEEINTWKDFIIGEVADYQAEKSRELESFLAKEGAELQNLKNLYEEKLKLEGPVKYWQNRAEKYKINGRIWLGSLTAIIIMSCIGLFLLLYNLPGVFHFNLFRGDPEAIRGMLIFFTIISFLAYLINTFSKLTFSAFHLQRDAEEREQLTLVFLALAQQAGIKDAERELVLQSLFSRSDSGLLGRDSSPTLPGIQNVFERFSK